MGGNERERLSDKSVQNSASNSDTFFFFSPFILPQPATVQTGANICTTRNHMSHT